MNKKYGQPVFMALVEGDPSFDDALAALKKAQVKKVLMAPFMLVAGDHALNDMAGDEEDSLASLLKKAGIETEAVIQGLGSNDDWANIYIERIQAQIEAAKKPASHKK